MKKRIKLNDVTFIILIRLDSIERLENILLVVSFLTRHFETNLNVVEYAPYKNNILKKLLDKTVHYEFFEDNDPILYRTRFLNQITLNVKTPFVAIWDADVLAPINQIVDSVKLLRKDKIDFVYPYDQYFLDTSFIIRKLYIREEKIELLEFNKKKMREMYPPKPNGGAFFAKMSSYVKSGMENENYYGWGVEDGDRLSRWKILGFTVSRINGALFHLSHSKGINSSFQNAEQHELKLRELLRIRRKNHEDLLTEINSWRISKNNNYQR